MTAATMMHRPASATRELPPLDASRLSPSMLPGTTVITLPRLRIPSESDVTEPHPAWPASSRKDEGLRTISPTPSAAPHQPHHHNAHGFHHIHHNHVHHREEHSRTQNFATVASGALPKPLGFAAANISPLQFANRSPSSPTAFPGKLDAEPKFGLAHLLEAAQHCHSLTPSELHNPTRKRTHSGELSPNSQYQLQLQVDQMAISQSRLHSIDYLINDSVEEDRPVKRLRPDLSLDMNVSYNYSAMHAPQQFHQSSHPMYQTTMHEATTPLYREASSPNYLNMSPTGSHGDTHSQCDSQSDSKSVWETVLTTGNFPDDVCLSENPSCCNKSSDASSNPVKQGRWTNDEKEFAENLIQQVRNGEVVLPPNMSLRKFIADSLQCKAMRVSKKFRSLSSCQSPENSGEERNFNPLSLHSIMNEDSSLDSYVDDVDDEQSSPKRSGSSKTLKRSDYSQHGAVRSGRWSVEEENYAKAMIEAFKSGYLPLHGNVSLRKFLSEVLVCHPMRISKKFVGYVRKYHWYRIAAGKCDPEAKRVALERLCQLEREFWASMQQNQEWASIQQENRS